MRFRYKAQKADGSFYESEQEADDKFALARSLREAGETPVYIRMRRGRISFDFSRARNLFRRVSVRDKISFARSMGGMIMAGLSVSRALGVLERQTDNPKLKQIISALIQNVGGGMNFSQALSAFPSVFPPFFASMAAAGEEGGNLGPALLGIAGQLDRAYSLQRKLRGALMYPAVVVAVLIVVAFIMTVYVVPSLTSSFQDLNISLPLSTRVVLAVSGFAAENTLFLLALIAAVPLAGWLVGKSARGRRALDFLWLRLPVVSSLMREANAARAAGTLSSLLSAGVPAVKAFEIAEHTVSNTYFKEVVSCARAAIQRGEPISSVFRAREDLYPAFLSEMMAVGEETGKLSAMLSDAASFFESEVDQNTKNLSTIIEPSLMVLVGAAVGFFAVSMITPMYTVLNAI